MSDEAVVGVEGTGPSLDKWRPAITTGVALIAVFITLIIFELALVIILWGYLQPLWSFWSIVQTGRYPVRDSLFYIFIGAFLLLLACFFVKNKENIKAILDELQLTVSRMVLDYLAIGLAAGAIAIIAYDVVDTLSGVYIIGKYLYIVLTPESLEMAVLFIIPMLIYCAGQVTLVQGYFQRTISKNYGWTAGLIAAAFIYALLFYFPDIPSLLQSSGDPDLFPLLGTMIVTSFIQNIIIGVIIAYLFLRSKSLYMPIGFILAWHVVPYVFDGFVGLGSVAWNVHGSFPYIESYLLNTLTVFLVLAFVWYFYRNSPEGLGGLKNKLQNVVNFFRFHEDEE